MKHDHFFSEAVLLAESVKGKTSPNPAVGCVIVRDGKMVAKGATQKAGEDHAELAALKAAKDCAKDSTLYVTLEPCVDFAGKKTPSCAQAIIKAGVKQVFVGMLDPNPQVNGKGIELMQEAGIHVTLLHDYRRRLYELNVDFFYYIQTGLPFVTAKAALTLDGCLATSSGHSQWISGETSRNWVQKKRNTVDAILVGIGTVLADNPSLTVRISHKTKDPLRIILDPRGETPGHFNIMTDEFPTLFVTTPQGAEKLRPSAQSGGKEILVQHDSGGLRFEPLFRQLASERRISSILMEGGSRVFYRALQEKMIHKLALFYAPKLLGGTGTPLFSGPGVLKMDESLKLHSLSVENSGEDILVQGYLPWGII